MFESILQIKSASKKRCLDIKSGNTGDPVKLASCHKKGGNQVFGLTKAQKIVTSLDLCIGVGVARNSVVSVNCLQAPQWNYDPIVYTAIVNIVHLSV